MTKSRAQKISPTTTRTTTSNQPFDFRTIDKQLKDTDLAVTCLCYFFVPAHYAPTPNHTAIARLDGNARLLGYNCCRRSDRAPRLAGAIRTPIHRHAIRLWAEQRQTIRLLGIHLIRFQPLWLYPRPLLARAIPRRRQRRTRQVGRGRFGLLFGTQRRADECRTRGNRCREQWRAIRLHSRQHFARSDRKPLDRTLLRLALHRCKTYATLDRNIRHRVPRATSHRSRTNLRALGVSPYSQPDSSTRLSTQEDQKTSKKIAHKTNGHPHRWPLSYLIGKLTTNSRSCGSRTPRG